MKTFWLFLLFCGLSCELGAAGKSPNLIYILADDLGYGDVHCLNSEGKIATPNLDQLGREGMIFRDAHTSSSVCTPSRYSIITGRYAWRSRLKSGVLGGMSPALIESGRMTVASFLKDHNYHTACIGKWHLGMNWTLKAGEKGFGDGIEKGADGWNADFSQPIQNGPTTFGFERYFGIAASLDMVPYSFIENDRVQAVPTVDNSFAMTEGRSGGQTRRGPAVAGFEARDVLPTFTRKAVEYIETQAKEGRPYFLYLPLNAPHTPIAPSAEWQGKSGISPYADFVMQTDATVGAVLDALKRSGQESNTLVIFTSDNGCSPMAGFPELISKGHNPNYQFRGHKADIYEGGHRVPFLVRWPERVKAGSISDQTICLSDLLATCADFLGLKLPDEAGEDSVSILPALEGRETGVLREAIVHHSINGSFSIRQGQWKLELCRDSGGWSDPKPGTKEAEGLHSVQLYDLKADLAEKQNVAKDRPEIVERLTSLLQKYVTAGRSTPGAPQPNVGAVNLFRAPK